MSFGRKSPVVIVLALACGLTACPFPVESGSAGTSFGGEGFDIEADFVVDAEDPARSLAGIIEIDGGLILSGVNETLLTVTSLEVVRGDILISDCPGLSSLTFRNLHTVEGNVRILDNDSLQNVTMNALTTVGQSIVLDDNPALNFIRLEALADAGGVSMDSPALNEVSFASLRSISGDVFIGTAAFAPNASAVNVSLPALTRVEGDFVLVNNSQMTVASAPVLQSVGGDFVLEGNPRLTTIDFPDLEMVDGGICVCRNASLDGCDAATFAEQVQSGQSVVAEDNRTDCTD